jgi:hypothetical protein
MSLNDTREREDFLPCGRALLLPWRRPRGAASAHGVGVGLGQVLVRGREADAAFLPAGEHAPGSPLRPQLIPLQKRPPVAPLQQLLRLTGARRRQPVVEVAQPDHLAAEHSLLQLNTYYYFLKRFLS